MRVAWTFEADSVWEHFRRYKDWSSQRWDADTNISIIAIYKEEEEEAQGTSRNQANALSNSPS